MQNPQDILFDWVTGQPGVTGAALLAAGAVCGFVGFRFARLIVPFALAGVGALVGEIVAEQLDEATLMPMAAGAAIGLLVGVRWYTAGLAVSTGATFGLLAQYLFVQFGAPDTAALVALATLVVVGIVLTPLSPRTMPMVTTTLQGTILMIVGFTGLTTAYLPALGRTFCRCASKTELLIPLLLIMLTAMAYSVQSSRQQGDMCTGR